MNLFILSPEKVLLKAEVTAVELPGSQGRFVVLKNHAPLLTSLDEGSIRCDKVDGESIHIPVKGGFAQIRDNDITVCVE